MSWPSRCAKATIAASTARQWRRSDCDRTHSDSRDHASSREIREGMAVTLAQPFGPAPVAGRHPLMEKFVIDGGTALTGTITPAGNKNGALPILAASVLTEDEVVVRNVPKIQDVAAMLSILGGIGVRIRWLSDHEVALCAAGLSADEAVIDRDLSERIRASFLLAGPLLARFGRVRMPPPGGDGIGRRR